MATLTLERPSKVKAVQSRRRAATAPTRAARSARLSAAKLQEVEDRLLAAAVAHHPNSDAALDRLLDDVERLPVGHPTRQATPLRRHHQLERMEDLLVQAVVHSHPHRPIAIERLLGDVVGDAAIDDGDEGGQRIDFDMQIDNDFDGMS